MDKQTKFLGFKSKMHRIKEPIMRDGIKFDSNEELEFYLWCKEAKEAEIISDFEYHPEPFLLFKREKGCPIKDMTYTADFKIYFPTGKMHKAISTCELVCDLIPGEYFVSYIEIKSDISRKALLKSRDISFPIKQAWIYQKNRVFINKVITRHIFNSKGKIIHPGFFSKTWVPKEVAWMKARKEPTRIKAFADCKLLSEVA